MIGKKITNFTLSVLCVMLSAAVAQAQSFNGSTTNTAGNSTFPSTGTGGCTVAPQNAGGTVFEVTVAGIPANAKLLSVQLNMTHTFDADLDIFLEAPGGSSTPLTVLAPQRIELSTDNGGGNDNYTNTVFCDAAATLISAGAAPFTGIFRPEGTTAVSCDPDGAGALTAYAGNIATLGAFTAGQNGVWKLRIFDDVGGDAGTMLGWSISFGDPTCSFSGVTLPAITIPGVDPAVCGATNASLTAPALACQTTITVFVDGTQLTTVNPGQSYIIPSLTSGVHIIKYSISACDEVSQTVTVTDGVPPTITCPPSVTINLDPGLCSTIFSYDISVSDNCPFFGPFVTLPTASQTQNNNFDGVTFDIQNVGTQPILITGFLAPIIAGAHTVNAYYTTTATTAVGNQANAAAWTFMGSANVTGNGTAPTTNVPIGGLVLQPGQRKGIYLYLTDLTTFYYANGNLTTTNGTLSIISNGHFAGQAPFINANAGRAFIGAVSYQTVTDPTPVQTAGLPSGSEFPKGTTTSCFQVADAVGNTSTCCFSVTVNEYANPVSTLVCNDFVYVSLDADCTEALNADQILEGGPYGCYDDYIVQIDKTPPFGNGPWVPAVLGPQDVGKTYAVQVTDPDTGNKCWGNLKVEDKLAPVLDCPPGLANCNQDLTPGVISGTVFGAEKALPTTSQTANNAFNGVTFDIQNVGAAPIQISGFIAPIPTGSHPVEVYYTTTATTAVGNQANAGAWTLLGTATVTGNGVFPTWPTLTTVPVGGLTLQPGDRKGIYVACADGAIDFGYANGDLTSTDGSLTIISQGHAAGAYPFVNANTPRAFIGSVLYKSVVDPPGFPNDLMLNVNVFQTGSNTYTVPAGSGAPVMENCSDVTLSYLDTEVAQDCNSGLTKIVNRKWTAVDASGNTKTCVMVINVLRPTLNDVELPPSYDNINNPAVPCSSAYPTPDVLQGQGLQGYPLVFGLPDGCTIGWTYTDAVVEVCDGTYKILREWKVIDWCTGTFINHSQIIKVLDEQGPSISCPANLTVSTDPFTCCAQVNLPDVIISDNCSRINNISGMIIGIDPFTFDTIGMFPIGGTLTSFPGNNLWNPDTLGAFGVTPCLPAGSHTVVYQAEDDCGNTSTCTFRLTVRDYVPPVAACDEHTTVAIGIDDPFDCYGPAGPGDQPAALGDCEGAGVTWVKATTFDDGSYDNCSNIKMTIRRMPEADGTYSDCIDGLNSINGHPSCDDFFPDFPTEFERAISEGDSIKFYCCEVGTSQTVILRIYQLDDFGNFSIGPDGTPIFNECMIEVEVQDKIKPACVSPANVTVSCEALTRASGLTAKQRFRTTAVSTPPLYTHTRASAVCRTR
ncbi:MAG: hypothetical protein IPK76_24655 [Lewinellaceae bacterium]|nr:hypothetical protein [Lewinellaceae bacterium]